MPIQYAFNGTLPKVVFDADILESAIDKGQQNILLEALVKELFRIIPIQFLGGGAYYRRSALICLGLINNNVLCPKMANGVIVSPGPIRGNGRWACRNSGNGSHPPAFTWIINLSSAVQFDFFLISMLDSLNNILAVRCLSCQYFD